MPGLVSKALKVLKNEGIDIVFYKIGQKLKREDIYRKWIISNEKNLLQTDVLSYNPLFSVVIPVYNVKDNMLRECIDSVLAQTYRNFEIILVDDASTQESVRTVLAEYDKKMPGGIDVKVIYRKENGHISRATNDGIAAAKGEYVALCDCDDLYAPNALYEIAKKINENPEYDFVYSDEDKISEDGKVRRDPFFKPDWSPETFMSYMYTCHLAVYRRSLIEELGGIRVGFEGSQDYDFVLRLMEKTNKIGHVPKILYHWRMRKESTANALTAKPYILETTYKAKKEALERRGLKGDIRLIPEIGQYRVTYYPQNEPLVSIVIPSKDNYEILSRCLMSIFEKTEYRNFEIILVDNGSNEKNKFKTEQLILDLNRTYPKEQVSYLYDKMEFNFSKMCNIGAKAAKGEFILFLNDDIEISDDVEKNTNTTIIASKWLEILAGQAQVSYTGAVGCKLYYPNTIQLQHAGVLNLRIGPGHCLYGRDDNLNYYYGRNLLDYNFTVVTGACLMVAADKFKQIGGFDEELPVAYNDVDLCFRLVKTGYYNVLRNDVALIHHESVSRGVDKQSEEKEARRKREMTKLYEKNPEFANGYDPCYNPNLAPNNGDFAFDMSKAYLLDKPKEVRVQGEDRIAQSKGQLLYSIDSVLVDDDTIRINGWAYDSKKHNNNYNKIDVVLRNHQGTEYIFETRKLYRSDVVRVDGSRKGVSLIGFESVIAKECLKDREVQIGIQIGDRYTMSDKIQKI